MSGDLRAALVWAGYDYESDGILATLAAADEPLTATVECPTCRDVVAEPYVDDCPTCHHYGRVRIAAMTEDVLRARLRGVMDRPDYDWLTVDDIVRAIFGETGDE